MESLQLPIWMETLVSSPSPSIANSDSEGFMNYDDNFADQFLNALPDESSGAISFGNNANEKATQAWMDNMLDKALASQVLIDESSPKNTDELLFEFDAVCHAFGVTPPDSPPAENLEEPSVFYVVGEEVDASDLLMESEISNDFLDELVRSRSSCLPDDVSEVPSSNSSACSEISSPRSDISSPRSDSSFDVSGFDEEWTPAPASPPKRKKRPYGRPIEEKKVRKKEQNKNAATRYRQKKKQQLDELLQEEEKLKLVHLTLKTRFDDTKREISYLKKLMREILAAKGFDV